MEVEPGIVECVVLEFVEKFSKLVANLLLAAFFVDQVNKVLLIVLRVGLLNVKFGCLVTFIEVLADNYWGRPLHVWLHLPDKRN